MPRNQQNIPKNSWKDLFVLRTEIRGKNRTDDFDANVVISLSGTHLQTTFKT